MVLHHYIDHCNKQYCSIHSTVQYTVLFYTWYFFMFSILLCIVAFITYYCCFVMVQMYNIKMLNFVNVYFMCITLWLNIWKYQKRFGRAF